MIQSFGNRAAEDIYHGINSRHARALPNVLHEKAARLLDQIDTSVKLETLKAPPGNRLEKLSGNLKDFWSIRINDQWRIIFKWVNNDAHEVQIVDYH